MRSSGAAVGSLQGAKPRLAEPRFASPRAAGPLFATPPAVSTVCIPAPNLAARPDAARHREMPAHQGLAHVGNRGNCGDGSGAAKNLAGAKLRRSAHNLDVRSLGRNLFDAVRYQLARLWTIVVAELHVRPRHQRDRNQAVIERFGRYRLCE